MRAVSNSGTVSGSCADPHLLRLRAGTAPGPTGQRKCILLPGRSSASTSKVMARNVRCFVTCILLPLLPVLLELDKREALELAEEKDASAQ